MQIPNEFVLTIKKDKKLDTIKLSSEYRNDILSSILKYHREFADKPKNALVMRVLFYFKYFPYNFKLFRFHSTAFQCL